MALKWKIHRTRDLAADPFIRPAHVCHPPESRLFGSGPEYTPKDPENCPVGTLWICECGRAWRVTKELMCWTRAAQDDVQELLANEA